MERSLKCILWRCRWYWWYGWNIATKLRSRAQSKQATNQPTNQPANCLTPLPPRAPSFPTSWQLLIKTETPALYWSRAFIFVTGCLLTTYTTTKHPGLFVFNNWILSVLIIYKPHFVATCRVWEIYYNAEWFHLYNVAHIVFLVQVYNCPDDDGKAVETSW
jgi:hypothetical protein